MGVKLKRLDLKFSASKETLILTSQMNLTSDVTFSGLLIDIIAASKQVDIKHIYK